MRGLTGAQVTRRTAILDWMKLGIGNTSNEIRAYLARYQGIIVTVDTVQSDLRAMEKAGTVGRWRSGRYWIWEVLPDKWGYEKGNEEARRQSRPDDVT